MALAGYWNAIRNAIERARGHDRPAFGGALAGL